MMDNDENKASQPPKITQQGMTRRRALAAMGTFTAALLSGENAEAVQVQKKTKTPAVPIPEFKKDENAIPLVTERFTIPGGNEARMYEAGPADPAWHVICRHEPCPVPE